MIVGDGPRQQLVLSDGTHRLRVNIDGTLTEGPVRLHYQLSGIDGVEPQLHTVRRLIALLRLGRFARGLEAAPSRADRLILMLRAYDLAQGGATHREIAGHLFVHQRVAAEWRTSSDSLRLRVQRLCRDAGRMIDGGYLDLLTSGS